MQNGLVTPMQDLTREERGKRLHQCLGGGWIRRLVAGMGPEQAACAPLQEGLRSDRVKAVFREKVEAQRDLFQGALRMQSFVELLGGSAARELEELFIGGAAAKSAGAVAGCEGGSFVQEEEFRPVPRLHEFSAYTLVLEFTDDPGFVSPSGGG